MSRKIIKSSYEMLDDLTPLKYDCGSLCGSACCSSEGYMIAFPYEREFLECNGHKISSRYLKGFGDVNIILCDGSCDRKHRPLSCRIFPVAPKFVDNKIMVRLDPRGRNICPLTLHSILSLDSEFTNTIKKMFNRMRMDEKLESFLRAISDLADEYDSILDN